MDVPPVGGTAPAAIASTPSSAARPALVLRTRPTAVAAGAPSSGDDSVTTEPSGGRVGSAGS